MEYEGKFHILKTGHVKCFLLECLDGYLLIDASNSDQYSNFLREIQGVGVDIPEIKYILITHHHTDHTGLAAGLIEETGAKLIVHKNAVASLKKGKNEDTMKPTNTIARIISPFFRIIARNELNKENPPVLLKNDDIILENDDGQFLRQIGINGKILYTPGHTADSISVLLDNGNAFVGDLVMDIFGLGNVKYLPSFASNIDAVLEGWDKLIEGGAKAIYPSHGDSFEVSGLISSRNKYKESKS